MLRALALICALLCAFFVFYTMRLFAVTQFLTQTRAGGGGAYIGAAVFPLLAILFGWAAVRSRRRAR